MTYPGVYVEEVPSGARPIAGVATSIAAFIGRTKKGDLADRPLAMITSYADFVERFGGVWDKSRLGHAVQDFYLNGGKQALICRVYGPPPGPGADGVAHIAFGAGQKKVAVAAASPGAWGNGIRVKVDHRGVPADGGADSDLFNLEVRETGGRTERFPGVSLHVDRARNVRDVLARESSLVRWDEAVAPLLAQPAPGGARVRPDDAATDGASAKEAAGAGAAKAAKDAVRAAVAANADKAQKEAAAQAATQAEAAAQAELDAATAALQAAEALPDADPQKAQKVADAQAVEQTATTKHDQAEAAVAPAAAAKDAADAAALQADQDVTTSKQAAAAAAQDAAAAAAYGGDDGADVDLDALKAQAGPALRKVDLFNLLCIPPLKADGADVGPDVFDWAAELCTARRALLLVDPPTSWNSPAKAVEGFRAEAEELGGRSPNAAVYFPRIRRSDPAAGAAPIDFVPCGAVAGVMARTDATRGVWKAPAGLDAALRNVPDLSVRLNDDENGLLNPLGINCLRPMPAAGRVVWGARTLVGADSLANQWKYVPVRRLALFIEESLFRGTKWVVFEPNDEPLWGQIRLNVGSFMHQLFRQGAFQGGAPRDAYFVKCDGETTTQADRNLGVVNIHVGFAPLKPAEFVVIRLQQMAGQIET
jgi:phage tail sheath protein FI